MQDHRVLRGNFFRQHAYTSPNGIPKALRQPQRYVEELPFGLLLGVLVHYFTYFRGPGIPQCLVCLSFFFAAARTRSALRQRRRWTDVSLSGRRYRFGARGASFIRGFPKIRGTIGGSPEVFLGICIVGSRI